MIKKTVCISKEQSSDYGINELGRLLKSCNFFWELQNFKEVILTNPKDCKNRISVISLANSWSGTGHDEWDILLSGWFVTKVKEANDNHLSTADISIIFTKTLLADHNRKFTQKQIYNHLIPFFDIISETDTELRLALRIRK